jgi:hypothetical protein
MTIRCASRGHWRERSLAKERPNQMKTSHRDWRIHGISILFAAVPVAFAAVRAVRTGNDFRYLWVALSSLLGASAVMVVGTVTTWRSNSAAALSAAVFVIATLLAVLAAWLLGIRVGPGSLVVGAGFGFCCAASCALYVLARP